MIETRYSVLMSVYFKENPEYLKMSIESMRNQTIKPNEIVLVKDGPLNEKLDKVINEYQSDAMFNIIELEENLGLGRALNEGLKNCKNEIIARMDTDDISESFRCEAQLKELEDPNINVVGSAIAEFIDDTENIVAYKAVEENHQKIANTMKYRNPMNHPSVMFRKSDVESVGGYKHWLLNEDYYLWVRMLKEGFRFKNIDKPLVKMRITSETYMKRGGWEYFLTQKHLFDYMLKHDVIGMKEYTYNNCVRFVARVLVPNKVRMFLYQYFLRERSVD